MRAATSPCVAAATAKSLPSLPKLGGQLCPMPPTACKPTRRVLVRSYSGLPPRRDAAFAPVPQQQPPVPGVALSSAPYPPGPAPTAPAASSPYAAEPAPAPAQPFTLDRVKPAGSTNYAQVMGYVMERPTSVDDRLPATHIKLKLPWRSGTSGFDTLIVEAVDDLREAALNLQPGVELAATGRIRVSPKFGMVLRAVILQLVDRNDTSLPKIGYNDGPRPSGLGRAHAAYSGGVARVKLQGTIGTPPPAMVQREGSDVAVTTAVLQRKYTTTEGYEEFPMQAYRDNARALADLPVGTSVCVRGRLSFTRSTRSWVVGVDELQLLVDDPSLPNAGTSLKPRVYSEPRQAAGGSGAAPRQIRPKLTDPRPVLEAHLSGMPLRDIATSLGGEPRDAMALLAKEAVAGKVINWHALAEEVGLAMVSGLPEQPPSLWDLMALTGEYYQAVVDKPVTKDGELKLKPLLQYIQNLKEPQDNAASQMAILENSKGLDAVYLALRLAVAAECTEGKIWDYKQVFPEDPNAAPAPHVMV